MKLKKGFVLRDVCGENVIMGEGLNAINFGRMLVLNESAAWLWKEAQAQGDFTVDSLTARLCEEYDISPEEAHACVSDILAQWNREGVTE